MGAGAVAVAALTGSSISRVVVADAVVGAALICSTIAAVAVAVPSY